MNFGNLILGLGVKALPFLTISSTSALAQDSSTGIPVQTPSAGAAAPAAPVWMNIAMLGGMFLLMWLFIIRPQSKRQKEQKFFLDNLKIGQDIVTSSGILGKVTQISDSIVTLNIGSTTIQVLKSGILSEFSKTKPATAEVLLETSK